MNETEVQHQTDPLLVIASMDTQPLTPVRVAQEPQRVEEDTENIEVVVAGHICLDIIPTLTSKAIQFTPGRLLEAGRAILATGGPVSNTGLALHKLGVKTKLMGKVGSDLFGQAILRIVEAQGAGLSGGMVIALDDFSSYSIILSAPGVDRVIIHAPGANSTFAADDIRYGLLENAALFHFGYPPLMERMYSDEGKELQTLFARAKTYGITTSLDLSMPDAASAAGRADWQKILANTLPYVDLFMPSIEELLLMLKRPLFEQLSKKAGHGSLLDLVSPEIVSEFGEMLLGLGAKIIGLKLGHRGLYLRTADVEVLAQMGRAEPPNLSIWGSRELWAPCFTTQAIGTTGAGDATIAGFLLGLLRNMSPVSTLAAACAVGACSVEAADALSGIRSWPETMLRIANVWPRFLPEGKKGSLLDMKHFGWQWDEHHEVWVGKKDVHY